MAVRVTATDVKQILDDSTLEDAIVNTYITGANALVNAALGTGTTDLLKEIERWMAAHMIAVTRERLAYKEAAGSAMITYVGEFKGGLDSSPYGQMVKTLDTTGAMAALDKKPASVYAVKSFT